MRKGTYGTGATLRLSVLMSKPVIFGGTSVPLDKNKMAFTLDFDGGRRVDAEFVGIGGQGHLLNFSYIVQEGDTTKDNENGVVSWGADISTSLRLLVNGSWLRRDIGVGEESSEDAITDANLTLPFVDENGSVAVVSSLVVDSVRPVIERVTYNAPFQTSGESKEIGAGHLVDIVATTDKAVDVVGNCVPMNLPVDASIESKGLLVSHDDKLIEVKEFQFDYVVQPSDGKNPLATRTLIGAPSSPGCEVYQSGLADGKNVVNWTLPTITDAGHVSKTSASIEVDTSAPTITRVEAKKNGVYGIGSVFTSIVHFNKNCTLDGQATLLLPINNQDNLQNVSSQSRNGDSSLSFSQNLDSLEFDITVLAGYMTKDLDSDDEITMSDGGWLRRTSTTPTTNINSAVPYGTASGLRLTSEVSFDTLRPTVIEVYSDTKTGVYGIGYTVSILLDLSYNVTITPASGKLLLAMSLHGGTSSRATECVKHADSPSPDNTLKCTLLVLENDKADVLQYSSTSSLTVSDGVEVTRNLIDYGKNLLDLELLDVKRLGVTTDVRIDGVPPILTMVRSLAIEKNYTVGDQVAFEIVFDKEVTPRCNQFEVALNIGNDRSAICQWSGVTSSNFTCIFVIRRGDNAQVLRVADNEIKCDDSGGTSAVQAHLEGGENVAKLIVPESGTVRPTSIRYERTMRCAGVTVAQVESKRKELENDLEIALSITPPSYVMIMSMSEVGRRRRLAASVLEIRRRQLAASVLEIRYVIVVPSNNDTMVNRVNRSVESLDLPTSSTATSMLTKVANQAGVEVSSVTLTHEVVITPSSTSGTSIRVDTITETPTLALPSLADASSGPPRSNTISPYFTIKLTVPEATCTTPASDSSCSVVLGVRDVTNGKFTNGKFTNMTVNMTVNTTGYQVLSLDLPYLSRAIDKVRDVVAIYNETSDFDLSHGRTYDLCLSYTDFLSNDASFYCLSDVLIDNKTETPSLNTPIDQTIVHASIEQNLNLAYTLPEDATNGTVEIVIELDDGPDTAQSSLVLSKRNVEALATTFEKGFHEIVLDLTQNITSGEKSVTAVAPPLQHGGFFATGGTYRMRVSYHDWLNNMRVFSSWSRFVYSPEIEQYNTAQGDKDVTVLGVKKIYVVSGHGMVPEDTFVFVDASVDIVGENCVGHETFGTIGTVVESKDGTGKVIPHSVDVEVMFSNISTPPRLQLCRRATPNGGGYGNELLRRHRTGTGGSGLVVARVDNLRSKCVDFAACQGKHVYVVNDSEVMSFAGNGMKIGDQAFWRKESGGTTMGDVCTSGVVKEGGFTDPLSVQFVDASRYYVGVGVGVVTVAPLVDFQDHSNSGEWSLCYKFVTESDYTSFPLILISVHALTDVLDTIHPLQSTQDGDLHVFQHFSWSFTIEGVGFSTPPISSNFDEARLVQRGPANQATDCSSKLVKVPDAVASIDAESRTVQWTINFKTTAEGEAARHDGSLLLCYRFKNDNWIEMLQKKPFNIILMNVRPPIMAPGQNLPGAWATKSIVTTAEDRAGEAGGRNSTDRVIVASNSSKEFHVVIDNLPAPLTTSSQVVVSFVPKNCAGAGQQVTTSGEPALSTNTHVYSLARPTNGLNNGNTNHVSCELHFNVSLAKGSLTLSSPSTFSFNTHGVLVLGRTDATQETFVVADYPEDLELEGQVPSHVATSPDWMAWIPLSASPSNEDCNDVAAESMFSVDHSSGAAAIGRSMSIPSDGNRVWERVLCYSFAGEPPVIYINHVLYVSHLLDFHLRFQNNDDGGSDDVLSINETTTANQQRKVAFLRVANQVAVATLEGEELDADVVRRKYNWNLLLRLPPWVLRLGASATTDVDELKLVPVGTLCSDPPSAETLVYSTIEIHDQGTEYYTHRVSKNSLLTLNGRPPPEDLVGNKNGRYQLCYRHGKMGQAKNFYAENPHLALQVTCDFNYWGGACTRCPGFDQDQNINNTCAGHGVCVGSGNHTDVTAGGGEGGENFVYYVRGQEKGGNYALGDCACKISFYFSTIILIPVLFISFLKTVTFDTLNPSFQIWFIF